MSRKATTLRALAQNAEKLPPPVIRQRADAATKKPPMQTMQTHPSRAPSAQQAKLHPDERIDEFGGFAHGHASFGAVSRRADDRMEIDPPGFRKIQRAVGH